MSSQFYSIRQTAEVLNVSYQTVFRKISEKEIPSIRMGKKVLVPAAFIESLITQAISESKKSPVSAEA